MVMRGYLMHAFRDLMSGRLESRAAWGVSLLVTSILFGLAHAYQGLAGIIMTGVIGFGYGLVFFAARRDLRAAILTHGLYDTVGFLVIYTSADKMLPKGTTLLLA
jgi:membrane protease YdiL (CAAX protease family)